MTDTQKPVVKIVTQTATSVEVWIGSIRIVASEEYLKIWANGNQIEVMA